MERVLKKIRLIDAGAVERTKDNHTYDCMADLVPSEKNDGGAVCKACAEGLFGDE